MKKTKSNYYQMSWKYLIIFRIIQWQNQSTGKFLFLCRESMQMLFIMYRIV
jgi:hypothetical protein